LVARVDDLAGQASRASLAVLVIRNVGWSPGSGSARNVRPTVGELPELFQVCVEQWRHLFDGHLNGCELFGAALFLEAPAPCCTQVA